MHLITNQKTDGIMRLLGQLSVLRCLFSFKLPQILMLLIRVRSWWWSQHPSEASPYWSS